MTQNSPIAACKKSPGQDGGWMVELKLHDGLAKDKPTLWNIGRAVQLVAPKIHTVTVQGPKDDLRLRVVTADSRLAGMLSNRVQVNEALQEVIGPWVENVTLSTLPMQMLVATRYRMAEIHLDHLSGELDKLEDAPVRYIARANPHPVYNGYVLSLLVPRCGEGDVFSRVRIVAEEALSFQL